MTGYKVLKNAEPLMHLVQAMALILGGGWVITSYFAHDRAMQELAKEQSQLNLQQASATLEIARAQESLRHIELEQNVGLLQAQRQKVEQEVAAAGQSRYERDFWLEGHRLKTVGGGLAEYRIQYGFEFTNTSDVSLELSLFLLDYFVGRPLSAPRGEFFVRPLGYPANRWNPDSKTDGGVEWQRVGSSGAIMTAAAGHIAAPWDAIVREARPTRGGAGTGSLRPKQALLWNETYIVRAPINGYLSFVINVCFDRCGRNEDLYFRFMPLTLSDLRESN